MEKTPVEKRYMPRRGLAFKLLIPVGAVLFASIFIWSHFSTRYQERLLIDKAVSDVDKFCNSVLKLTWFAMLHSPSEDMQDIMESMAEYNDIQEIRLYNCQGQVRFSNSPQEIGITGHKEDISCRVCHSAEPPVMKPDIKERTRIFSSDTGELRLGVINPILNGPSCSSADCHYHPPEITKLGSLDVVVSLEAVKKEISLSRKMSVWTAVYLFAILAVTICVIILFLVTHPINRLIKETRLIALGKFHRMKDRKNSGDEIGQLSTAINAMGKEIQEKQTELNLEKTRYQYLFEQVPCTITVQNKKYELIEFNQEFARRFNPSYGDHCYAAYKDLDAKCMNCPVEKTFKDGKPHFSEESGVNKDGSEAHWFVKTAPLLDEDGRVVAAMEMSLDISRRKKLEEKVRISEKKYQAIFKNIPNPVFILHRTEFTILDCNDSALAVYGYARGEIKGLGFDILFPGKAAFEQVRERIDRPFHERVVNVKKDEDYLYVNIWISPADFVDKNVLIVTAVDITNSVETEHQLIQAGKMATLGEMATGVAHELNQPLSVIKTASGFIARKISSGREIDGEILKTLSGEIESHVDRASKITNHMRLFGRKSEFRKEAVNINDVLTRAFDIFSQQLKLREIDVIWELGKSLPLISADPVRLEQVFINLLINARDSIVAKFDTEGMNRQDSPPENDLRQITLKTHEETGKVRVKIRDTGTGIASLHMDKIFEPFFTTKKVGQGTGLGLSISYGIIRESGGEITVHNNKDGGATFIMLFTVEEDISG
ncbi:MAG: ATP-binding protein [Desulfobacterales bacterium]|nr:ATP-binding protein [Desulfobacterales bacterium]